jgi:hypothetical protein
MNATKKVYEKIPDKINIPKEFIHKKGEIIIIVDEDIPREKKKLLKDFWGILPDFPERPLQREYEKREIL